MNTVTLKRIVVLGALTGMRSMAGLATLALPYAGVARPVMALAVAGEMIADKTPWSATASTRCPSWGAPSWARWSAR